MRVRAGQKRKNAYNCCFACILLFMLAAKGGVAGKASQPLKVVLIAKVAEGGVRGMCFLST